MARGLLTVLALLGVLFGVLERLWLLAHLPLFGDEAIVGLMARQIRHGHFSTFYWGQHYGGLEPYVAAITTLVNGGPMGLNAAAALLSALAAALAAAVVRELTGSRPLAVLAGCVAWVWPYVLLWNGVRELGFRYAALCCGLAVVLLALRFHRGRRGAWSCLLLGGVAGAGWWASPEILYFAVPVGILLVASVRVPAPTSARGWYRSPGILVPAGAVVGASPWLYTNITHGFVSLRSSSLPSSSHLSYAARLSVFAHKALPMQLGLKSIITGVWIGGPRLGSVLLTALLALVVGCVVWAAWVLVVRKDVRLMAIGLAVVAFPFLFAADPASGYWADGRYGIYFGPLTVLLVFGALGSSTHRPRSPVFSPAGRGSQRTREVRASARPVALVVGALLLVGACVSTSAGARSILSTAVPTSAAFFRGWSDPNEPIRHVVTEMRDAHIRYAYGDYWTAYDIDFLAPDDITVTPSPLDVHRVPALFHAVTASRGAAWLFFAPSEIPQAAAAFSNPQPGPGVYSEQTFTAFLRAHRDAYRVVHLGVLDAVVPATRRGVP